MKRLLFLALILIVTQSLYAQSLTDSVALEAFMDGLITGHMKENKVAGATLSIVHKGKVILKKGYGFADLQSRIPVNADTTLFRIGSISKMFVWVSVMQLVAEGKLDLNKDVNTYLKDIQIPAAYDQPITLTHLMTHTPGFEDHVINLFAKDSTSLRPLSEILKDEMPARVRPPYTQSSYSNHGTGIAAHVVENVSGMSFYDYMQQKILTPLKMDFAAFSQPLPPRLKKYMSNGYRELNNEITRQDFEFVPLYPVGAASASAESMTHFMLALLQHGNYKGYQMLDSATLALMKSNAHQHHPQVNPMRYGFMDLSQNGVTVIGHGGDTFWFHSLMALLPDQETGIFFSVNTDKGGGIYMKLLEEFMDRFYPEQSSLPAPIKVSKKWLLQFAGEYEVNRYPHDDLTKISALMSRGQIAAIDSTRLRITFGEDVSYYVPIDSTTFREEFSSEKLAFEKDKEGKVIHAYLGGLPIMALDKKHGLALASNQTMIFVGVIITALLTVIYWPLAYFIRRKYSRKTGLYLQLSFPEKSIAWFNYLFILIFVIGLMMSLSDPLTIVYGVPSSLKVLLVFPIFAIITTLGMLVFFVRSLGNSRYSVMSRLCYLLLCVISVIALWQLSYWNLLGFNY